MPFNPVSARKGSSVFLRCITAWSVFHSHQYAIHGLPEPGISQFGLSVGGVGIITFFALSGYYMMGSHTQHGAWPYMRSRLLRVMPALLVCTLLTVTSLGLMSSLGLAAYWQHPQTQAFLKQNSLLWLYPVARQLPGVFAQNTLPWVNPSLWILPYVWLLYVALPLLWAKKLWPLWLVLSLTGGFIALGYLVPLSLLVQWGHPYDVFYLLVFTMVYFTGVGIRQMSKHWHLVLALYAGVVLLFGWMIGYLPLFYGASLLLWSIGTLWVCTRFHLDKYGAAWGDPSYGMYLYAFPVQQVCAQWLDGQGFGTSYGIGLLITVLLGYASWHWVEKPLMTLFKPLSKSA